MVKRISLVVILLVFLLAAYIPFHSNASTGWLGGYAYRKSKLLTAADSTIAAFTITGNGVPLNLHKGAGTDDSDDLYFGGLCQDYFNDIRVTESDGITLCPYYLQEPTATTAKLNIQTNVTDAAKKVYIYYGNPAATAYSNGSDTFQWFDDFNEAGSDVYDQIASTVKVKPWTWSASNPIMTKRSDTVTALAGAITSDTGDEAIDRFFLKQCTASASGTATHVVVRTGTAGYVKVAIYADNAGEPGSRLAKQDTGQYCWPGLNYVKLESSVALTDDAVYWIAHNCGTAGVVRYGTVLEEANNRYKAVTYSTFTFPDPAGSSFSTTTTSRATGAYYSTSTFPDWESLGLRDPILMIDTDGNLVNEGGNYIMYYSGYQSASPRYNRAIGRATVSATDNITITRDTNNPILTKGAATWEYFGVQAASVIKRGTNDYIMYYSGVGSDWANWGVGIATSTDGILWTRYGSNPILTSANFTLEVDHEIITGPRVIKLSTGDWFMALYGVYDWSSAWDFWTLYGATTTDNNGVTGWAAINSGNSILDPSAGQWDDDTIVTCSVTEVTSGTVVMFYAGCDTSNLNAARGWEGAGGGSPLIIGAAYASTDDLTSWTKYADNPIMNLGSYNEWNDGTVETIFIAKDDIGTDTIRCWFAGHPFSAVGDNETNAAFGFATCDQNAKKYVYTDKWTKVGTQIVGYPSYSDAPHTLRLAGADAHTNLLKNTTGTFDDFVLESHVKLTVDSNTYSIPEFFFRYADTSNDYLMLLRGEASNDIYTRKYLAGVASINNSSAFNYTAQWYWFKAAFKHDDINSWIGTTAVTDLTDADTTLLTGSIGIQNYLAYSSVLVDAVWVRKYAATEPAWSTTGSKEIIRIQHGFIIFQDPGIM